MKNLELYLLTFNCGRSLIQPDVFGSYLFDALPNNQRATLPDILVISLEEIAPIGYSFLGGSFLTPYYNAFRKAVKVAAGEAVYVNVVTRNVGMTAIMIFVKKDIVPAIAYIQTAGVGFGLQEMGNKGAVGVRLGFHVEDGGEDTMEATFVAAHLAPMEDGLERRNDDWKSAVQRMVFVQDKTGEAVQHDEQSEEAPLLQGVPKETSKTGNGLFSSRSHLFIGGDLNYRISSSKPGPDDYKRFPNPKAPQGDPLHYSAFLSRDQLSKERLAGRTLQGLTEPRVNFPPTYKYSTTPQKPARTEDLDETDWASHRWPSWCDRILYLDLPEWTRTRSSQPSIRVHGYNALPLFPTSDHRPVAMSLSVPWMAFPAAPPDVNDIRSSPPFAIDPEWHAKRSMARKKELVVGLLAYLGLTWEGNGLLTATVIGALGGYLMIKSLLAT